MTRPNIFDYDQDFAFLYTSYSKFLKVKGHLQAQVFSGKNFVNYVMFYFKHNTFYDVEKFTKGDYQEVVAISSIFDFEWLNDKQDRI